jgi:hypothetical protein
MNSQLHVSTGYTSSYRTVHKHITNLDLPGPVFASAVSTAVQLAAGQLDPLVASHA